MKLLEQLKSEIPHHVTRGVTGKKVYALVRQNFDEITEARKMGYSWTQIIRAAKTAWAGLIDWDKSIGEKAHLIDNYYYKISKEESHND